MSIESDLTAKNLSAKFANKLAIVIPAQNEQGSIQAVIAEIGLYVNATIYVVDDCSSDNTAKLAQEAGAVVLPLVTKLGAWGATQAGIRLAQRHGCELVVTMDADGQHNAKYLPAVIEPVAAGIADVSIGSWPERASIMRQVAWKLLRLASAIQIEDITSGFRVYNKNAVATLCQWRATFLDYQDVGVLALLLSSGMEVVDVRTPMRLRHHGKSRIFNSWIIVLIYMFHSLALGLTKRRIKQYRPRSKSRMTS